MTDTESTSAALARALAERAALQARLDAATVLIRAYESAHWRCVRCGYFNAGPACTGCGRAFLPAEDTNP